MIISLVLLPLLSSVIYYILARAEITRPLWSRYPNCAKGLVNCPACLGFWIGIALGVVFCSILRFPFMTIENRPVLEILLVGLCSTWWTPVLFYIHQYALIGCQLAHEHDEE